MILDIKCGTGMANRGFCVLITIDVVAIYNGIVEIIIKQNVKPPIPRKCACEMRIQSVWLNISKLNKMRKTAQVTKI